MKTITIKQKNPLQKNKSNTIRLEGCRALHRHTIPYYYKHAIASLSHQNTCVYEDCKVEDLIKDLINLSHIEATAVLSKDNRIKGIIARKEISEMLGRPYGWDVYKRVTVKDITKKVPTAYKEEHYLSVFKEHSAYIKDKEPFYIILTDSNNNYAGIVSTHDMLVQSYHIAQRDMTLARNIQKKIIKNSRHIETERFIYTGKNIMAKGVGGDYQNIKQYSDDKWVTMIGDVSGKGIAAAMAASLIDGMFSIYDFNRGSKNFLQELNRYVYNTFGLEKYITALLIDIDFKKNIIKIYDMGHSYVFIKTEDGFKRIKTCMHNMPLGIIPDISPQADIINIKDKTTIFAHTDGLIEQKDKNGMIFSYKNVAAAINNGGTITDMQEKLIDSFFYFMKNQPQDDDTTFFLMEFKKKQ